MTGILTLAQERDPGDGVWISEFSYITTSSDLDFEPELVGTLRALNACIMELRIRTASCYGTGE